MFAGLMQQKNGVRIAPIAWFPIGLFMVVGIAAIMGIPGTKLTHIFVGAAVGVHSVWFVRRLQKTDNAE